MTFKTYETKYKRQPVEAYQWDGERLPCIAFNPLNNPMTPNESYYVDNIGVRHFINKGDYITQSLIGILVVIPKKTFEDMFDV